MRHKIHPDFVRLMPNYLIRVGSARGTTLLYNANNFLKLYTITTDV